MNLRLSLVVSATYAATRPGNREQSDFVGCPSAAAEAGMYRLSKLTQNLITPRERA